LSGAIPLECFVVERRQGGKSLKGRKFVIQMTVAKDVVAWAVKQKGKAVIDPATCYETYQLLPDADQDVNPWVKALVSKILGAPQERKIAAAVKAPDQEQSLNSSVHLSAPPVEAQPPSPSPQPTLILTDSSPEPSL